MEAYHSLEEEYDIIVIEGAGSPAEINLQKDDIVNMGMARMAKAPVLLCGDIDRGGVFASLYGTIALLPPEEQKLIRGTIINKFRGDVEILRPGLVQLEQLTGKPVLGVVPMLDVDVDDEDSLSQRLEQRPAKKGLIDIAVIRLPRLSNFTDFNALERMEEVTLRYVRSPKELGKPDLVILPGTKNTMDDLRWLRESGLETVILKHAAAGGAVVGICGGYQMLGRTVSDPEGVEGGGTLPGLGLLPTETVFLGEKTRTRVEGVFTTGSGLFAALSGVPFAGYEIHMGVTTIDGSTLVQIKSQTGEEKADGCCAGNVWGSYVHGIFDRASCAQAVVNCLRRARGLEEDATAVDWEVYQQQQYDKLAAGVRASLDMQAVYDILERGVEV